MLPNGQNVRHCERSEAIHTSSYHSPNSNILEYSILFSFEIRYDIINPYVLESVKTSGYK
jgi:hypothetical protein